MNNKQLLQAKATELRALIDILTTNLSLLAEQQAGLAQSQQETSARLEWFTRELASTERLLAAQD